MANNRIFYAVQAVGIGKSPTSVSSIDTESKDFRWMKGVQSVGINTNFSLEQVFELGQLELYQNIENIPEVEVTIEKVIDGRHLLYLQSVGHAGTGNIVQASNQACDVYLAIYPDSNSSASGSGLENLVYCSGLRVGSINYTFPVAGNATESITLVGNDKIWQTGTALSSRNLVTNLASLTSDPHSPNTNVGRRQHFNATGSVLPSEVSGAIRGGSGNIQNINISTDFGRENLFEQGSFRPYAKIATYPISVTCSFEVISVSGDRVNADGNAPSLVDNPIKVQYDVNGFSTAGGALTIDLGSKNKLQSVSYTGGDTGGGNATVTYQYQSFNKLLVSDSFAGNGDSTGASGEYWTSS